MVFLRRPNDDLFAFDLIPGQCHDDRRLLIPVKRIAPSGRSGSLRIPQSREPAFGTVPVTLSSTSCTRSSCAKTTSSEWSLAS